MRVFQLSLLAVIAVCLAGFSKTGGVSTVADPKALAESAQASAVVVARNYQRRGYRGGSRHYRGYRYQGRRFDRRYRYRAYGRYRYRPYYYRYYGPRYSYPYIYYRHYRGPYWYYPHRGYHRYYWYYR